VAIDDSLVPQRRRDSQQWLLDWLVKQTGRVQNFERDERLLPSEVKSYKMIPRVLYKRARHFEEIAEAAVERGHSVTAAELYWRAAEVYRDAQHSIFEDDNSEKIFLHRQSSSCYDAVVRLADQDVELVEVPWEGVQIQARFHFVPGRPVAPTVLFIPGMDMTKESFPSPLSNPFRARGFHVLSIDGPGQGISNLRKIRVSHDNYERAASAAIDYLAARPEVDPDRIVVVGSSFGSHWGQRVAALDPRVRALATNHAVYGDKRLIFEESSPRFKQVFMYMAGLDEDEFDAMAARLTTQGYGGRITCPALMVMGEYDPLCYLEAGLSLFDELSGPKELWVLENEFHRVAGSDCLGGMDAYPFMADWLADALSGRIASDHRRLVVLPQRDGAGPYQAPVDSPYIPDRYA